jgi:MFS family permease
MDVFKPSNARWLLFTRMFGQAGDGLLQTALATFVLFSPQREANPTRITIVFALLLVPYSIIGPFVGVLIDKWSRQKILLRANLIRVAAMLLIAVTVAGHSANLILTVLVLASLGINRFILATQAASLPHVVTPELLTTANALFPPLGTMGSSLAVAVGLGIQHLVGNTDGTNAGIIVLGSGSVLLAGYSATRILPKRVLGPHGLNVEVRAELRNVFSGIGNAVTRILEDKRVFVSMLIVVTQRCAFGAVTLQTLLLARRVWHPVTQPDAALSDFGLAAGSTAVGIFIAAALSALVLNRASALADETGSKHRRAFVRLLPISAVLALSMTVSAVALGHRLVMFASALSLGLAGQFMKINADTTIQQRIDDAHRGRVFAIFDMVINVATVGGIALFALVAPIREHAQIAAFAVGLLLSGVLVASIWLVAHPTNQNG